MMKTISIIMILLICSVSYSQNEDDFTIDEPDEPVIPDISGLTLKTQHKPIKTNIPKKNEDEVLLVYDVGIIFQDNTLLKGIISFTENSLKVSHVKNNFVFEKSIKWNDIKSILITEWRPSEGPKSEDSKVMPYYFYPSLYQITMKKGEKYIYKKNIPHLNKLILTNDDGSTSVFSYFMDYWNVTGDKTGFWKNTKSTYFYAPVKNPLKKTIKIINFK